VVVLARVRPTRRADVTDARDLLRGLEAHVDSFVAMFVVTDDSRAPL
jgi:hypothetical protein